MPTIARRFCAIALAAFATKTYVTPAHTSAEDLWPCTRESALVQMAQHLVVQPRRPTSKELLQSLRQSGSDLPSLRALWWALGNDTAARHWLERIPHPEGATLACGEASDERQRLLLVGVRGGSLRLAASTPTRFCVDIAQGFQKPKVIALGGDGSVHILALQTNNERSCNRSVSIPRTVPMPAVLQLQAHGSHGVQTVAERWMGPHAATIVQRAWASSIQTREDVREKLSRLRREYDAREVRENHWLDQYAFEYAQKACASNHIVHELVRGQHAQRRLKQKGIDARLVGEVISRGQTTGFAFAALAQSPGHILTMIDRRFTDAGVGIIEAAKGRVCMVILFASWPRIVAPE